MLAAVSRNRFPVVKINLLDRLLAKAKLCEATKLINADPCETITLKSKISCIWPSNLTMRGYSHLAIVVPIRLVKWDKMFQQYVGVT